MPLVLQAPQERRITFPLAPPVHVLQVEATFTWQAVVQCAVALAARGRMRRTEAEVRAAAGGGDQRPAQRQWQQNDRTQSLEVEVVVAEGSARVLFGSVRAARVG